MHLGVRILFENSGQGRLGDGGVGSAADTFQRARGRNQVGFMWTFAQSANPVKPPGTKARDAATRVSCSGPK